MTTETLWTRFTQDRDPQDREQLLLLNLPLVRHVARRMSRAMERGVELDDLVGAGTMGLVDAVESFQPERGLAFSTYAAPRIRGAILDDLRRRDPASRSVRRKERALAQARAAVSRSRARAPRASEVAGELGIEVESLWRWELETERTRPLSLDQPLGSEDGPRRSLAEALPGASGQEVEEALERERLVELLQGAILEMKEQDRIVLSLYYFEGMKLREIAEVLGVTESRVCQVRSKAIEELRGRLAHLAEAAA